MPGCSEIQHFVKTLTLNSRMAKSEIPSITVQSSGGGLKNGPDMDPQYPSGRPSRLEKQEEFEVEEEPYIPSPVTIQIEDRGSGPEESPSVGSELNGSKIEVIESVPLGSKDGEENEDASTERNKVPTHRVKLLVRSHAVHDDASPPPDLETIVTNTNMLSVTSAPAFATQTQSKSSSKKRLGRDGSSQGSQGSTETSSSGLSRDSSTETYTDSTGIDLQQFIIDTLHKNQKDRIMLLKIEQELILFIKDNKRHSLKFGSMSSYNRMLVHRVGAFFGLDHYVDSNGTSVIVNKTKNTRLPDSRFQDYFRDELLPEEPKKSILKRDSISFEENKEKSPERQSSTDSRHSKSFEEREEEYEKARARIFHKDEGFGESPLSRRSSQEDIRWPSSDTRPWSSTDSDSSGRPLGARGGSSFETEGGGQALPQKADRPVAVLTKAESDNKEYLYPNRLVRPVMTKASSFGGISVLSRESSTEKTRNPRITKAESFSVTTLSSSHVNSSSLFTSAHSPLSAATATSPSLVVSTSIGSQTSVQSLYPIITAQQTFPTVAGQTTQLQIPVQQLSSQVPGWSVRSHEAPHAAAPQQQQQMVWSAPSSDLVFPGSIVINPPPTATSYVNLESLLCRSKLPPAGQAIMLTPYQPMATAPASLNQVPISSQVSAVASISPPIQPQPSLPQQQKQSQPSIQLPMPPQHQPNLQPMGQAQTVFYVPYIQSQIQTPVTPQLSMQMQQPQPSQQTQLLTDHMLFATNPNPSSVDELTVQMPNLSLVSSGVTPPQQKPAHEQSSGQRSLITIDPSTSPHGYVVPGYKSPQGNIAQFPLYYVSPVQQTANVHPVRYVYPAAAPSAQQVQTGSNSNVGISGQLVTGIQAQVAPQVSSQLAGSQFVPGYPILALSQSGEVTMPTTLVSYTLASQTAAVTTTTSALIPSSPMSMQVYPYGNLVISNPSNANQMPYTAPPTTKVAQSSTFVQTPIALHTPAALPVYVITTSGSQQTPTAQPHVVTGSANSQFGSMRSQSLPSTPSSAATAMLNQQMSSTAGTPMGFLYTPAQQMPSSVSPPQHVPAQPQPLTIATHTTQSVTQLAPSILATFQVLRPNIPLVETVRNSTPPPANQMQNLVAHYVSQSPSNKVPLSFPFVKQASDPGADCFSISNVGSEQSRNARTNQQFHMITPSTTPGQSGGLLYHHRGVPLVPDVCLVGHSLQQHHFNPLMLPQQRPLSRFIHPSGSNGSTRPPKNRNKRTKGGSHSSSSNGARSAVGTVFQPLHDLSAGHVLEIENLPEGMKRTEVERYLEQVTSLGAKIQFLDAESGNLLPNESDFVVTSQHLTIAVFDTDTSAQSALLGIKTPKFQLRPLRRNIKDVSQKKYS